ncbi:MAG TPA: hypothetical protein VLX29_04095 [Nitrospirota bacterium]|nr:hypothetical protein [Nitrospirota bacterium]
MITNTATGAPLPGRYVWAQSQPNIVGSYSSNPNYCGPDKFAALTPTDANGKYTLQLRTPGTYYLYEFFCIVDSYQEYTGNPCMDTKNTTDPVLVSAGASVTVNFPLNCRTDSTGTICL